MSSLELDDGHNKAMPVVSIETCVNERRKQKFQILSRTKEHDNYFANVKVTPRLTQPSANRGSNFSCSFNALHSRHMDRFKQYLPDRHQVLEQQLSAERQQVEQELATARAIAIPTLANRQLICQLQCRLWVIKGVLDHGIDEKKLKTIAKKHQTIGTAPTSYFQPELYQR